MGRFLREVQNRQRKAERLNNALDGAIASIMKNFMQEVDDAGKDLLKLVEIDLPDVDFNTVDYTQLKKLMEAKGISFKHVSNPAQPLRLLILAIFEDKEFIVGYLIYMNPILNVIKRTRIDNENERNAAYLFLEGKSDSYVN